MVLRSLAIAMPSEKTTVVSTNKETNDGDGSATRFQQILKVMVVLQIEGYECKVFSASNVVGFHQINCKL